MKICKKCGKIVSYNSYFKAYYCDQCGYYEPKTEAKINTDIIKSPNLRNSKMLALSK